MSHETAVAHAEHAASHPAVSALSSGPSGNHRRAIPSEPDALLALAREAGMLVTLDGQIGREKYQSVVGSVASLQRFAAALHSTLVGCNAT